MAGAIPFFLPVIALVVSLIGFSSTTYPVVSSSASICVIGAGVGGSSLAYFLKTYSSDQNMPTLRIFEKSGVVGGRMATVKVVGDTFEAGASIIHPKNMHAVRFAQLLNLKRKTRVDDDASSIGIWDGRKFLFKTISLPPNSRFGKIISFLNSFLVLKRYGWPLFLMQRFVERTVNCFLKYYQHFESRPVFETVEEMLKWANLHSLTQRSLQEQLAEAGLSQRLISELVTVITRINYGQDVSISALAGTVSLAGSDSGLWSVEGGNWKLADGLINHSNASLNLHEEIISVSRSGSIYVLDSTKGSSYICQVVVIATPLDELNIDFSPPISVPQRKLQHTYTTFVRGLLNPAYFGLNSGTEIPDLVGTIEDSSLPFSCIGVQKTYNEDDKAYKVFSRSALPEDLLDQIFSTRKETIQLNWAAYPHFEAPEVFAPFVLDGFHLYYINAFENAASTIETSSVAAENVARLILTRLASGSPSNVNHLWMPASEYGQHVDL
ncbi:farnesylcysteine lyase [Aristolochia californica]|uniref:farnesylcysteine lyase n=1 Tax=Aristolochia californica TaxID=171875 RepID=UPI0035D72D7C